MKVLLYISLFLISCQKPNITLLVNGAKKILKADTTINGIWDGNWRVFNPVDENGVVHQVHGKGSLTRWIINAPLTSQIFDTSINIVNCKTYNNVFSCGWYGAKSTNADNWWNIQKSINTCINNGIRKLTVGVQGILDFSQPLEIISIYKNEYVNCTLNFYGESSFWDSGNPTTLNLTRPYDCGLNIQVGKGVVVENIKISGQYKSPITPDSVYYNTSYDNYKDISGYNCDDWYYGIVFDWRPPIDGRNINGSTGCIIRNVFVTGFTHLIAISQNNITKNAEILLFENIHLGDGKTGFINGQAQEKGNIIRGVYAWDNLHTVFSIGTHAQWAAGDYHIDGGNLAGRIVRVFDINASGWFSTSVENLFCEGIGAVGTINSANLPISISNCTFDFKYKSEVGPKVLLETNNPNINFNSCMFRYYGSSEPLDFNGIATFNNCYFSGIVI